MKFVIRADAGIGLPAWKQTELDELNDSPANPLTLIDFVDRRHQSLRERSRRRRSMYMTQHWYSPDADANVIQMQQWFASRPKG